MIKIQDVFNLFYNDYTKEYTPNAQQVKAARAIMQCRTAALGGHTFKCDHCDHIEVSYNSCRNRHCPLCQGIEKAVWIDKRSTEILNCPYFHVIFTMPQELQILIYSNQQLLYALMYKAVGETLTELSWDIKYLGAQIGFLSILHTWGQDLHYHPHIHTIVMAGGLSKSNQWENTSKDFFIPVDVQSKVFRGKFLYYLDLYYKQNKLEFHGESKKYETPNNFKELVNICYNKNWYTYTQDTFTEPLAVIKYLGRYTHRIAISNERVVSIDDQFVTISIKDYKDNNETKMVTMKGTEFIRRFLMHILPKGFVKIRHYGILANRNKKTKLELCRQITFSPIIKAQFKDLPIIEIVNIISGKDVLLCKACNEGKMQKVASFAKGASP